MSDFEGVVPAFGRALARRGYEELTPVQKSVLEGELGGADALVSAQTGSGKTVAFGLAMAPDLLQGEEKFGRASTPLALIVAPTRELAMQVKREIEWLYTETGATVISCVGGMDIRSERRALERGAHIVVATPGRLCDHIRRNAFDPSGIKAVVLDEADEMLDLGFREDLEYILENTPEERRTLLFSATVPPMIAKLAKNYQRDAVRVTTTEEKKQHVDIEYRALMVAPRERENAIINVLRYYEAENALVFCNTRAAVNRMVARFSNRGFSVVALSGELSQNERSHALQALRDGRARVCIATDVAARGIDLPKLELVIHSDLPSNPETLLHRSGRTGRAGRKGISALIVDARSRSKAERILRFAKINATWAQPPSADEVNQRDEQRILESEALTGPVSDEERAFVEKITGEFSAEQIAAAFLRASRADKSAPEDLHAVDFDKPRERKFDDRGPRGDRPERGQREKARRVEFDNSVWVSLSVGRKQRAEPRWLIPMLCNAGGLTKSAIGAITMQTNETFVQLDADHSDPFFDGLGANQTLEKNITVTRLDGAPKLEPRGHRGSRSEGEHKSRGKPKGDGKPMGDKKPKGDGPKREGKFKKDKKPRWDKAKRQERAGEAAVSNAEGGKASGQTGRPWWEKQARQEAESRKSQGEKRVVFVCRSPDGAAGQVLASISTLLKPLAGTLVATRKKVPGRSRS